MELPPNVKLASPDVKIDNLHPRLLQFMETLAIVHHQLYGLPLVVTSGNDGQHADGSLHYEWRAFDYRTKDIPRDKEAPFVAITYSLGQLYGVEVLDERAETGKQHVHVGYRGA